jgi:hypothetical protein
MINVVLAKSYSAAVEVATNGKDWVAIETEYGENTLGLEHPNVIKACNHHGEHQMNEAPAIQCSYSDKRYDNFIVSHIDLDVLFGILWSAGWLKKTNITRALSELVAKADIDGFHTINDMLDNMPLEIKERYYAIGYLVNSWVFNDDGKLIKDISKETHKLLLRVKDIIIDGAQKEQIALYEQWMLEQKKVVKKHLQMVHKICDGYFFAFRAPFSLITAYSIDDMKAKIIIQYNEQSKSITLGCYDEKTAERFFGSQGVIEPLVKFFGDGAGGKKTVGGTPRESNIQPEMLNAFIEFIFREYLNIPETIEVK